MTETPDTVVQIHLEGLGKRRADRGRFWWSLRYDKPDCALAVPLCFGVGYLRTRAPGIAKVV